MSYFCSRLASTTLFWLCAVVPIFPTAEAQTETRTFSLKAESPKFWDLIDSKAQLSKIAGGFGFTEGPVWDERGFLYVSDEEQNKIYQVDMDGGKKDVISLGDPDGNAYDRQRRLFDLANDVSASIVLTHGGQDTLSVYQLV